jgi:c(7)-type cytochrome triheme protein
MVKTIESRKDMFRRRLLVMLTSLGAAGLSIGVSAEYADVVLNRLSDRNDVRPVIFPHWFHRIRFRCKVCHNELGFKMRAGANEITMGKIIDGQYCGLCHNNEIAWGVENCDLCHSGKSGLKTGIRGSNQTGGPGRW